MKEKSSIKMRPSYLLGIVFIVLVSVIWSAASVLVQYLFRETEFNSPFLLTYIGTSLFIVLIPLRLIWERREWWIKRLKFCENNNYDQNDYINSHDEIIPWRRYTAWEGSAETLQELESWNDNDKSLTNMEDTSIKSGSTNGNEQTPFADDNNISSSVHTRLQLLSHIEHIHMAMKIAPLWFFSNYFYNISLSYTTITASTVLSSTGSVFTFLFAVTCGDEYFSKYKCCGVALALCGSIVTSIQDVGSNNNQVDDSFLGDIFGLISAVGYGGYTVMLRMACPKDEEIFSMQLLLGYIGLLNMLGLSPVLIWLLPTLLRPNQARGGHDADDDAHDHGYALTWFIFGCIVVKGLFDNVLSDYLWARAICLTSATVASVGIGLTIPLALLSDIFIMNEHSVLNITSIFGALCVLVGFIFTNLSEIDSYSNIVDDDNQEDVQLSFGQDTSNRL